MKQTKINYNVDRIQRLINTKGITSEEKLSLSVALDRLSEGLSLTPASLRILAKLEMVKGA